MRHPDVRDHPHLGACHPRQIVDLPLPPHRQLHHRRLVGGVQIEQRERHPDLVVVVAGGAGRLPAHREYGGDHLLGRRLPGAAGDGDDPRRQNASIRRGQRPERLQCIRDDDRRACRRDLAGHERGRGPSFEGLPHEVVAVEAFPLQRDEQRAARERAAVGRDPAEDLRRLRPHEPSAGGFEHQRAREISHPRLPPSPPGPRRPPPDRRSESCGRRRSDSPRGPSPR